jgi:hypothetical protein
MPIDQNNALGDKKDKYEPNIGDILANIFVGPLL